MTEVIEKTENKKGYKKTKLGWIPEDWINTYIGKYVDFIGGSQPPKSMFKYQPEKGYIRLLQIRDYKTEDYATYIPEQFAQKTCNSQDVMIGRYGPPIFQILRGLNGAYNVALMKAIPNEKFILKDFLFYVLQQEPLFRLIDRLSARSCGQTGIDIDALNSYPLLLPSIIEQKRIVETIKLWELAIEILEKLIEQKEVSKKAIMQKLFLEKESWKMIRFDKIFKDFCKKNCPEERLLSATQENGVIPRDMLSGKVMSPEGSLEGYKLIEAGDFVISLRSFQGGLEYSKYRGILSPAYTVLKNIINIDKDFYRHFFKSYKFIEKYLSISVIGIRDGKQISYSDLSSVKIPYPPLEEQEKIGKILNCCDEEIQILNSKLEKLKEQKKGLMQKLLTGQIRVKV